MIFCRVPLDNVTDLRHARQTRLLAGNDSLTARIRLGSLKRLPTSARDRKI